MFAQTIKRVALVLTLAIIGLTAPPAFTEQPAKPSANDYQVILINRKCGNRTLHGFYRDANDACRAAEQLRRDTLRSGSFSVEIVKGVDDQPLPPSHKCTYEVYRNPCKGYLLQGEFLSLHEAVEAAAEFVQAGDKVEIVTRYSRN
jgi:hypothetical protein